MRKSLLVFALAGTAALGACTEPLSEHLGTGFGDSTRQNFARQVVNPEPATANDGAPAFNGRRGGLALERYETGKVTAPVDTSTKGGGSQ